MGGWKRLLNRHKTWTYLCLDAVLHTGAGKRQDVGERLSRLAACIGTQAAAFYFQRLYEVGGRVGGWVGGWVGESFRCFAACIGSEAAAFDFQGLYEV